MNGSSNSGPLFPGVVVAKTDEMPALLDAMNESMRAWTAKAARGECGWICSDCCASFSDGMPDACAWGHQSCTDIIKRDKEAACTSRT